MEVEIVGMPTVREPDGLAMSSRNAYLNDDDRVRALALSKALDAAKALYNKGIDDTEKLIIEATNVLVGDDSSDSGVDKVDYVEMRDAETFEPVTGHARGPVVMVIAAVVGKTRLLDNCVLTR